MGSGLPNVLMILGFTLVPMLFVGFVVWKIVSGLGQQSQATQQLLATGIPAQGRITQLQMGGGTITVMGHRHLMLNLQLEVHPPNGAPYYTQIQQTISELMLPSVQPGTVVALRIDPANPMRVAIAGNPQQAQAVPGMGYPQQGMAAPGPSPFAAPDVSGAAKRSLPFMIGMFVITTVPITAIMLYVFVDWGAIFHTGNGPEGGYCAAASRCCREISGPAGGAACSNYETGMMPSEGCRLAFENYQNTARTFGKVCK